MAEYTVNFNYSPLLQQQFIITVCDPTNIVNVNVNVPRLDDNTLSTMLTRLSELLAPLPSPSKLELNYTGFGFLPQTLMNKWRNDFIQRKYDTAPKARIDNFVFSNETVEMIVGVFMKGVGPNGEPVPKYDKNKPSSMTKIRNYINNITRGVLAEYELDLVVDKVIAKIAN